MEDKDELIGLECEWFQDYENYKEVLVFLNGALDAGAQGVQRVKCLVVLGVFGMEVGAYTAFLKGVQ